MRFLHIADLHLGKTLNDVSFLPDQAHILNGILNIAREQCADAVLIAGDVYQRSNPSAEAVQLFDSFITRLSECGKKVFIISGNHDSSERISYFSALIRQSGIYASEAFTGKLQKITLTDEYGLIHIHLLPFIRPADVRRLYPERNISTYQDALQAVMEENAVDKDARNVLLCHQFIMGGEVSDSEEMSIGTLDQISASLFDAFDYVALGHLHKPQRAVRDAVRYAGSPLKYSFSEAAHKKSATIVDINEKGNVKISVFPLSPVRDLRLVKGYMEDILKMPPSADYVWVTVTDEIVAPDARLDVMSVFPNMMKFTVSNSRTREDIDIADAESLESKSVSELFCDFYRLTNGDQPPTDKHMEVFEKVLRRLEDRKHAPD